MTIYSQGETAIINAEVTNSSGTYIDPTSILCTIDDPTGTQKATGAMTKDAVGYYHYDYALASDATVGTWRAFITAVVNTRTVIEEIRFVVEVN